MNTKSASQPSIAQLKDRIRRGPDRSRETRVPLVVAAMTPAFWLRYFSDPKYQTDVDVQWMRDFAGGSSPLFSHVAL